MSEAHDINNAVWAGVGPELVAEYEAHPLRPVEEVLIERYRADLQGPVLEIGTGAGRLSGRLLAAGAQLTGLDIAPAMVRFCRSAHPAGRFSVGDLTDLSRFADGTFRALLAGYNVLDVLAEGERLTALEGWRRVLAPGGLLIFSSHNLAYAPRILRPGRVVGASRHETLENLRRRRARIANHRRLAGAEQRHDGWALINDEAHDHALLHYYTTREHQARQLADHGWSLAECLALDGTVVEPGHTAASCPELHYVARRAGDAPGP